MFRSNLRKRFPLVVLITVFLLYLHYPANAAKLAPTTKNTSTTDANSSNVELISAPQETNETTKVIEKLPAKATDAIAKSKTNNEEDTDVYVETNPENEDSVEAEETEDDEEANDDEKSDTALTPAEKDDDTTSAFSIWGIVPSVWNWIRDDLSAGLFGDADAEAAGATKALVRQVRDVSDAVKAAVESRTFGKIRRLQMALIPLIFKFGVLTAMVAFLIMLGMKTLFLVKLLVLMNAAAIFAKLITLKSNFGGHEHSAPTWNYQSWSPPLAGGWAASAPGHSYSHSHEHQPTKEIHLHIHGGQVQGYDAGGHGPVSGGHGWASRSDPYAAYASAHHTEVDNEFNNQGPISMLPTRYPPN